MMHFPPFQRKYVYTVSVILLRDKYLEYLESDIKKILKNTIDNGRN